MVEGIELIHVYPPPLGRKHEFSLDCWCHPEPDDEEPLVVIHQVEQ